jgi:formamidopyrimidine-DNA glycosylase
MPELPDITLYVERLAELAQEQRLESIRIGNPFVLRTLEPKPEAFAGRHLQDVGQIGKRIVLSFDGDLFAIIHLMIAGRLRWRPLGSKLPKRQGLVAFNFTNGTLLFTEVGSKRRASLHLVEGANGLSDFERGGVNMLQVTPQNEMNYCPGCQTGGRILADRALSHLLKKDWPRTLEELERLSSAKRA